MLQLMKFISLIKSDLIGISASIACIIHCLAAPALVSLGYVFNITIVGQWHLLDYFFIALAVAAVYLSARNTPSLILKSLFWVFVSIFSASILLHERIEGLEMITLASSLVLIFLHFFRLRLISSKKLARKAQ